jgi:hypothetical protein
MVTEMSDRPGNESSGENQPPVDEPTFGELIDRQGQATPQQIARILAGEDWALIAAPTAGGSRRSPSETTDHHGGAFDQK